MKARSALPFLISCLWLVAAWPSAAAAANSPEYGATEAAATTSDPRLRRTSEGEQVLRQVGDAVFARPFFLVRLVAGVALLPVALPTAAVVADWRDAIDFCATGPWEMLVRRPLGE